MPLKSIRQKARRDLRQGKSPRTAAGEFVREEIRHIRAGRHGVRNAKQAIAIGLSEARRSGIPVPAPRRGTTSSRTRRAALRDTLSGQRRRRAGTTSRRRSSATRSTLRGEARLGASALALSRLARRVAARRSPATRSRLAKKAASTRRRTRLSRIHRGR